MSQNYAAGALTQLVAKGAMDTFLHDRAETTYWRSTFARCTSFSMETVEQNFHGSVQFGSNASLKVQRTGDLLFHMYLKVVLPGIALKVTSDGRRPYGEGQACKACTEETDRVLSSEKEGAAWRKKNYHACDGCDDDSGIAIERTPAEDDDLDNSNWCHWANAIGQLVIKQCSLRIGGQQVDTMFGEFMFCWEEVSGRVGRRLLEMVGKRYTRQELIIDSREKRTLYVPLPFWFTQASGSALALASLQFHSIDLEVDFRSLKDLIVVNTPKLSDDEGYEIIKCGNGTTISNNNLHASLLSTYVYLEDHERQRFSNANFETLIVQHQHYQQESSNSKLHRIQLPFNHPVIELMWFVRRKCNAEANNWFNFSGLECRDPLEKVEFTLNNQTRFGGQDASYYRLVQPYQVHSCIPDAFVYCYSFALHPEDTTTPSGSCNFSRIDHATLVLHLQHGLEKETTEVWVYATSWNVARHRQGLLGVAYSN